MITLTAEIEIKGENPLPFKIGSSKLGTNYFGATVSVDEIVDKRNIISLDGEVKDRGNVESPNWGIISSGGSISFKDKNSLFLNYANMGLLTEGLPIKIFLKNTISKNIRQCGSYYTESWSYDIDNRCVDVNFKDDLEEWQDINVEAIEYDPRKPDSKPMSFFYEYIHSKTPKKYNMKPFSLLDQETKDILENTIVMYPMLDEANLWSQWQKLCESVGAYIYKNKFGETVLKYAKGS